MKKPVMDYSQFSFSRLNEAQFSHLKLLWAWVGYFAMYVLTEQLIPRENCYVIHCALDDMIPFNEWFVIPYVLWYLLVAGSLLYFALYDTDSFIALMKFIIVTQVTAMLIYIVFPNRQDMRPEQFARDNLLTDIVSILYTIDTSTNVCPSLHVAYSLGIASTWIKSEVPKRRNKLFITVFCLLVCLSTVFIKQHSVLDGLAAIPVCLLAERIAYKNYWRAWRIRRRYPL